MIRVPVGAEKDTAPGSAWGGQNPETPPVPRTPTPGTEKDTWPGASSPPQPRDRTDAMEYTEAGKRRVDWLCRQLIGPAGKDGLIGASPLYRYPAGVLYPVEVGVPSGIDPAASGGDADSASLEDEKRARRPAMNRRPDPARPVRRRRDVPPPSVGFSFFVRGPVRLSIAASAAFYKRAGERDEEGRFRSQGIRQNRSRATGPGPGGIRCAERIHLEGSRRHRRPRAAAPGWRRPHRHSVQPTTAGHRPGKGAGTDREVAVRGARRMRGGDRRTRRVSPSRPGSSDGRGTGTRTAVQDRRIHGAAVDWDADPIESRISS